MQSAKTCVLSPDPEALAATIFYYYHLSSGLIIYFYKN